MPHNDDSTKDWLNCCVVENVSISASAKYPIGYVCPKAFMTDINTHLPLGKMDTISHTCVDSVKGSAPNRRQTNSLGNVDAVYWRIYTALGGNELRLKQKSWIMPTNRYVVNFVCSYVFIDIKCVTFNISFLVSSSCWWAQLKIMTRQKSKFS